ncbi:MAG: tRNA pseudouridine(38-40) synthase TruA [Acidimicrobiaceae bacterium]|nr:tRNA pseudouridine(38-40) synthase TruA [Acidimicrobiaceae bacterium]
MTRTHHTNEVEQGGLFDQETPLLSEASQAELESCDAAPDGAVLHYAASISYVGTGYHGIAYQAGQRTVIGVLGVAIERALRHHVEIVVAGRTDSGVHALGQVISFSGPAHKGGLDGLYQSLARQLPDDVSVNWLGLSEPSFSARHSARYRHYLYRILPGTERDATTSDRSWQVPYELDLPAMRSASYVLVGEHDFAGFCKKGPDGTSTTRRVYEVRLQSRGRFVDFEIWANAFCHQMVRGIVGSLVEVGKGRSSVSSFARSVLYPPTEKRYLAPPRGLYLVEVGYGDFSGAKDVDPLIFSVGEVPNSVYAVSSCLGRKSRQEQVLNR